MGDHRLRVTSFADRLLNRLHGIFGKDRELEQLSNEITSLKRRAYADSRLTDREIAAIQKRMAEVEARFATFAADRGFPLGNHRPASPESFKVYREQQEIHFEWLAGKDLRSGAVGELSAALRGGDTRRVDALVPKIAQDLVMSTNLATGRDKVGLLRAALSLVDDRGAQEAALAKVRHSLEAELTRQWPMTAGRPPGITLEEFDKAARFETAVSVQETPLPPEVRGNNKIFPNRPLEGWEQTTRAATRAAMDDLERNGQLFLSKIPAGAGTADVAVKLDLNLGIDGPPSITDPATTGATLSELLERAKRDGKSIRLTVGDSCGGENVPLGRTTMDILRDTGNYHHALKAGLRFAAAEGDATAAASLAKLEAAEARGVFFGSKDDRVSTPDDLAAAERAAAKYVVCVDYDAAGYAAVDPQLGPIGLAAWGTREFNIARPWVEADFRVHIARGLSTHVVAGWTGSVKGLIGLHAFGLRPVDQGMDKRGDNLLDTLPLLTQVSGFAAVLGHRTGLKDLLARIAASRDPALGRALEVTQAKWDEVRGDKRAWEAFSKETAALAKELRRDQEAGMPHPALMEKMRLRTRAALDRADALAPGFRQAFWDATATGTRFFLVAAQHFRKFIPDEMKDAQAGMRIGLLTQLPYPSDLVIKSQPKMGEGGGPDAYSNVRDVGVIIAGTDEAATDALAWKRAGKTDNLWRENFALHGGLVFGRGPMHHDEIRVL